MCVRSLEGSQEKWDVPLASGSSTQYNPVLWRINSKHSIASVDDSLCTYSTCSSTFWKDNWRATKRGLVYTAVFYATTGNSRSEKHKTVSWQCNNFALSRLNVVIWELSADLVLFLVFIWNMFHLISKRLHQPFKLSNTDILNKTTRGFTNQWQALKQFPALGPSTPTLPFKSLHSRLTRLSHQHQCIILLKFSFT